MKNPLVIIAKSKNRKRCNDSAKIVEKKKRKYVVVQWISTNDTHKFVSEVQKAIVNYK